MKLDNISNNKWDEYDCYLSGSYIYFFKTESSDLSGYYYLNDVKIGENIETYQITLSSNYGIVTLKFLDEVKYKDWLNFIYLRIKEIKVSIEIKNFENLELMEYKGVDLNNIFMTVKLNVTNFYLKIYDEEISIDEEIFLLTLNNFDMKILLTEPDTILEIKVDGIKFYDHYKTNQKFSIILDSYNMIEKKDYPIFVLISSLTEKSTKYKGNLMEIEFESDYISTFFDPESVRKLLEIVAHCDQLKDQIRDEFLYPPKFLMMEKLFILPLDPPENKRIYCNKLNYLYMKICVSIENFKMIWLQPKLNHYFQDIITKDLKLNFNYYIDHLEFSGSMMETTFLDCTNYPYTINYQKDFSVKNLNPVLGSKDKNTIHFEYKSYAPYCHLFTADSASKFIISLDNMKLFYVHELFLRVYNYLFDSFLYSFVCSEKVQDYKDLQCQVPKKKKNEVDCLKLEVNYKFIIGIC